MNTTETPTEEVNIGKYLQAEITNELAKEVYADPKRMEIITTLVDARLDLVFEILKLDIAPEIEREINTIVFNKLSQLPEFKVLFDKINFIIDKNIVLIIEVMTNSIKQKVIEIETNFHNIKNKENKEDIRIDERTNLLKLINNLQLSLESILSVFSESFDSDISKDLTVKSYKELIINIIKTNGSASSVITALNHVVRTPLSIIRTNGELIVNYFERMDFEKIKNRSGIALIQLKELEEIIESLNEYKTIKSINTSENPSILYANELEDQLNAMLNSIYLKDSIDQDYSINIQNQIESKDAVDINLNSILIAVEKIIDNSISFRKKDEHLEVNITLKIIDNQLIIEILDNGKGIKEDHSEEVTKPFISQYGEGTSFIDRRGTGLGLGLYKAKKIIEDNNGSLTIESKEDSGTTVSLSLPIAA